MWEPIDRLVRDAAARLDPRSASIATVPFRAGALRGTLVLRVNDTLGAGDVPALHTASDLADWACALTRQLFARAQRDAARDARRRWLAAAAGISVRLELSPDAPAAVAAMPTQDIFLF